VCRGREGKFLWGVLFFLRGGVFFLRGAALYGGAWRAFILPQKTLPAPENPMRAGNLINCQLSIVNCQSLLCGGVFLRWAGERFVGQKASCFRSFLGAVLQKRRQIVSEISLVFFPNCKNLSTF
jgi:hypothetical protein